MYQNVPRNLHFIIWKYALGGIEKSLDTYFDHFNKNQLSIFSLRPIGKNNILRPDLINKVSHGSNHNLLLYCKYITYVKRHKYEDYICFNTGSLIIIITLIFSRNNKVIYYIRGTKYNKFILSYIVNKGIWQLLINKSRLRVIANSNYSKEVFISTISNRIKVSVIYNPFNTLKFYPKTIQEKLTNRHIIFVGRMVEGKNLYKWLNVAKELHEKNPCFFFSLVGDGPLRNDLENYSKQIETDKYVKFTGSVRDTSVFYHDAHLMLFLSEYESFGNVVVESILCGTPVLALPISSMKEIFNSYTQFLLDPEKDISSQILGFFNNYDFYLNITLKASKDFIEKYEERIHISKILKLLKQ